MELHLPLHIGVIAIEKKAFGSPLTNVANIIFNLVIFPVRNSNKVYDEFTESVLVGVRVSVRGSENQLQTEGCKPSATPGWAAQKN